jgi:hypothetical protein
MFWPHPDALNDLEVEETENGFDLSAPDDTECGEWLKHYSSTEELRLEFQAEFINALITHIEKTNGKDEIPDQLESGCSG